MWGIRGRRIEGFEAQLAADKELAAEVKELEENFIATEEAGKIVFDLITAENVVVGLEQYLEKEAIDMLVMFKEKESFWERLFSPSLTKKIALHGKKPLLVLKRKLEVD